MAEWRSKHPSDTNAITSDSITQGLKLGREPDANAQVSYGTQPAIQYMTSKGWGANTDSKENYTAQYNGAVSGTVATVTYTNLHHSTYTGEDGVTHSISKIVRTFSNMQPFSAIPGKTQLIINSDPTDGFVTVATSVDVTDVYYDELGNPISFDPNTAYITVASLNSLYYQGDFQDALTGKPYGTESVRPLSSTDKSYSLAGSSVTVHSDGSLYADQTNQDWAKNNSWKNSGHTGSWDSIGTDTTYYGAGVISLSGTEHKFRFFVQSDGMPSNFINGYQSYLQKDTQGGNWFTMSTVIPVTPTPRTSINYHYDTPSTFSLLYFRLLVNNNL